MTCVPVEPLVVNATHTHHRLPRSTPIRLAVAGGGVMGRETGRREDFNDDCHAVDTDTHRNDLFIILAASLCHMLNDIMQSLLTSIYPLLKPITNSTSRADRPTDGGFPDHGVAASDSRRARHGSLAHSLLAALRHGQHILRAYMLAFAHSFPVLVFGACLIGFGSAVFHLNPRASRRAASGGRHGLAQSFFQVGGNAGTAIGRLLAAFIVLPFGQESLAWFASVAVVGMVILTL